MNLVFVALLVAVVLSGCTRTDDHAPSPGALGMPGAVGTIALKPDDWIENKTTWWKDSDGIDPATPGCHIGTDESGAPNGRMFGEACLSDGRLVESNPGAEELHSHVNDTGYPDTFDCKVWCQERSAANGICVAAPAPPCSTSAKCECT